MATKKLKAWGESSPSFSGTLWKLGVLGTVDAIAVTMIMVLIAQELMVQAVLSILVLLIVNWIYLRKGGLPAKYLTPGVLFLIVFQVYVTMFSGYTAFTNYGSAHNGDKALAIQTIKNAAYRIVDGPDYTINLVKDDSDGSRAFLMTNNVNGKVSIGKNGELPIPLGDNQFTLSTECADKYAEDTETCPKAALRAVGYTTQDANNLSFVDKAKYLEIRVITDPANPNVGLRTSEFTIALPSESTLVYDEIADTFTALVDDDYGVYYAGDVFKPAEDGFYRLDGVLESAKLDGGWRVEVGLKNFETIFTDVQLRDPLIKVISWTFIFAISTVLTTFILGLFIALVFNHEKLRGKKFYRLVMILPYAFPGFLSAYVWVGLLNRENGFINTVIFGQTPGSEANFPWLLEEGPARLAVLLVNLWLGFPYMFLITTGALQSIPSELNEAAEIDGATGWQNFRLIKLPLLLISIAPLLIASFAFNFNNFTIIYLLTKGGPADSGITDYDVGGTDILITFVYKIAFSGTGQNFGLASAFSILIFVVVATISLISFKRTKKFEEIV
jgi:arabinogalactan oligomer/maltooligosaccharide transport system permease protein